MNNRRVIVSLVLALLVGAAIAEIVSQSRAVLYHPDEMLNADAALNLFRHGDYTSRMFGGFRFDPAISTGILATWTDALVFAQDGNLFQARVVGRLLQLVVFVALITRLMRRWQHEVTVAAAGALAFWLTLVLTTDDESRTAYRGELWGALILAISLCFTRTRPLLASFVAGCAVWLVKLIYLPFALPLLIANVSSSRALESEREQRSLRCAALHAGCFLLPLAMWMALIWWTYDLETVARWLVSELVFAARHGLGVALPLDDVGIYGWRFEPVWNMTPFLRYPWSATARYLVPIATGTIVLSGYAILDGRGLLPSTPRHERIAVRGTIALVIAMCAWFFVLDPTQWGRHLLSVIYIGAAVSVYAIVAISAVPQRWGRATARAATAAAIVTTCLALITIAQQIRADYWKSSYAIGCGGPDLVTYRCTEQRVMPMFVEMVHRICPDVGDNISDVCITNRRAQFITAILERLREPGHDLDRDLAMTYLVRFMEHRTYRDWESFVADVRPIACGPGGEAVRNRLTAWGIDVTEERLGCVD